MKKRKGRPGYLSGIFIFLLFFGVCAETSAQAWNEVKWVDDGDTILLKNNNRVRYIGINTPEVAHKDQPAEPYGYAAKKYNIKLVYGKQVRIEYDRNKKDRYGRLLAYVFLKDGKFVNEAMIREGYAYCLFHKENSKYSDLFLKTQREAMKSNRGIWRKWQETGDGYVGNRESKRFHLKKCSFAKKIAKKNRIYFKTKWNAFRDGYAPAKQCLKEYWRK
jgi:micrococcal nuclease